jgi:DNA-binding transcriptional ArsR family regulator
MGLRIHLTAEDLARTSISATMGPLAETVMAMILVRCPRQDPAALRQWRRIAKGRMTPAMKPLAMLIPPGEIGVDLATLTGQARTIDEGIKAVLALPGDRLLREIEDADRQSTLPRAAWAITETGSAARKQLADAIGATHRALVEPYWTPIRAHLDAERGYQGQILMDGGVERLLSTLLPRILRWRQPVLEVLTCHDGDIHLDGRGLTLVPSAFVGDIPLLLRDPGDPTSSARLMFGAIRDPAVAARLWAGELTTSSALAALVGRTRALALSAIGSGCSTTELARRSAVSLAAASQHAAVLRDAGLITTHRQGSAVLHVLTPLGTALLKAGRL